MDIVIIIIVVIIIVVIVLTHPCPHPRLKYPTPAIGRLFYVVASKNECIVVVLAVIVIVLHHSCCRRCLPSLSDLYPPVIVVRAGFWSMQRFEQKIHMRYLT